MKRLCTIIIFFSLFLMSVCLPSDAPALVRIVEDLSAYGSLSMSFAEQDDEGDTTPPSSTSEYYVTVNNHSRRYVGVCIDQVQNGTVVPIENGTDDKYMGPASEIFSYKFVEEFFKDIINWTWPDYPPATRIYAIPKPDLSPGSEVRFPIRVIGPAWGKRLPYDLNDPLAPRCYGDDVARTTIGTSVHMLILPLLSQLTGAYIKNEELQAFLNDFIFNFGILGIEVTNDIADGDALGVMENIGKWMLESKTLEAKLTAEAKQSLEQLKTYFLTPVALLEVANIWFQLAMDQWVSTFEVRIVQPRVDSLRPEKGTPGSTLTIKGIGFDELEMANNRVYFSDGGGNRLEATVLHAFDESTLVVQVPESFSTGPVTVCTPAPFSKGPETEYCSNSDVVFTEDLPLSIVAPTDGATVSGIVNISVELRNPPDPFPSSEAQLWVDDLPFDRKEVAAPTFVFAFDTTGLTLGMHSVEVWLNTGEKIYTSSPLRLYTQLPSGTRLIISSPSPDQHFYKNQPITFTAEILNGPVPTNSSETLDYTLSVNGNAWSYKSVKPYTSYPGCYEVTFSLADLELQGENVLSVRAVGKNGTTPLYDLTASVKIWVDDAVMEYPNPMEISGCIDSKSPIVLLLPWLDHSKLIDQAFSFGTCGPDSAGKYSNYMVEVGFQDKMTSPTLGTYYITRNSFSNRALSNKPFRFYTAGTASNPTMYIKSSIYDLPSDNCRWPANQSECKIYNYTKEWCEGFDCWPSVGIIDSLCTADPYYPDTTDRFKVTIYTWGKHPCAYYVSER